MAQSKIRSFLILVCLCTTVLETAAQIDATAPANQQELSNFSTPQVRITEPTGTYKIVSWSGDRPSILVKGDAIAVPEDYRLFIAVHPTQSDNVWSSEVGFRGRQWVSQAFFGDQQGLPRDGDTYQVLAVLSKSPLPERFNEFSQTEYYASNIITVRFRIVSWLDKLVAFGKDLQLSVPIAAFFSMIGVIIGYLIKKNGGGEEKQKDTTPKNHSRRVTRL